ncbi:MAG: hypothetical protein ACI9CV_002236, partial [Ilumatobacter sp.]
QDASVYSAPLTFPKRQVVANVSTMDDNGDQPQESEVRQRGDDCEYSDTDVLLKLDSEIHIGEPVGFGGDHGGQSTHNDIRLWPKDSRTTTT